MTIPLSRPAPIGLDIGNCSIKAVQSRRSKGVFTPIAMARFPRLHSGKPVDVSELTTIAGVLRRQGFAGCEIVVSASADKLKSSPLELPSKGPNVPIDRLARAEFSRLHKIDLALSEFSSWEIPSAVRAGKATSLMAVAYPHSDAEQQIGVFEAAEFRVRVIDVHGSSLVRACSSLVSSGRASAILEIGWTGAVLVLVRDRVVAYERRIADLALSRVHADLEGKLRLSFDESLTAVFESAVERPAAVTELLGDYYTLVGRELSKTLSYTRQQHPESPVEQVILAGGGADLPHIAAQLETLCGVQTTRIEWPGCELVSGHSALASAYGLSQLAA
jgi:Tfp pilus assembly PilM family ATPase